MRTSLVSWYKILFPFIFKFSNIEITFSKCSPETLYFVPICGARVGAACLLPRTFRTCVPAFRNKVGKGGFLGHGGSSGERSFFLGESRFFLGKEVFPRHPERLCLHPGARWARSFFLGKELFLGQGGFLGEGGFSWQEGFS